MPSQEWLEEKRLGLYRYPGNALTDLEERFVSYMKVNGENPAGLARALTFEPIIWGQNFPVFSAEAASTSYGSGGSDKQRIPGSLQVYVRAWSPALMSQFSVDQPGALSGATDGRQEAKKITRAVHDVFHEAFHADRELRSRVSDMRITATDAGDVDRFGQSRVDETSRNILWAHTATIEIIP